MKKYIYMAVVAIAALSSCSSDNDPILGETGKQTLTFTATMEGVSTTRATYDATNKCASWETTDQISINGKTYNAQSAGLTTTFKAADQDAEGSTYNAYFACTYDGTTATLPSAVSETWADGKFNMPMYATSTTTNLEFKNLCGVLKITVKDDEIAAVKRIKISSANKAISGNFSITNDAAVLADPSVVANTLTITYADAVATTPEGKVFYVAIPAQTYQELKIELDADGNGFTKSMTTKSATDITVARNKIYPITFADNSIVFVSGITLNRTAAELILGGEPAQATTNLTATIAPENATDKTVTWSSSDNTIATVSAEGVVTAVKAGTATITATAHDGSGATATCAVTVKQLVTSISLDKTTAKIDVNSDVTLAATVNPTDASNKELQWTTSDQNIATVDQAGKVTGVAPGDVIITATAKDGSGKTATCTVSVSYSFSNPNKNENYTNGTMNNWY